MCARTVTAMRWRDYPASRMCIGRWFNSLPNGKAETGTRKEITMHIDIRPAVLILVLPLFAACSAAQSPADRLSSELEKVAVEEMKADGIPGAAIGVVSGGKLLLAKGFGVAS